MGNRFCIALAVFAVTLATGFPGAAEPARGESGMVLRMLQGMASYISGQIAKLAPDAVRFETPEATVGVRGTRFLARVTPE